MIYNEKQRLNEVTIGAVFSEYARLNKKPIKIKFSGVLFCFTSVIIQIKRTGTYSAKFLPIHLRNHIN